MDKMGGIRNWLHGSHKFCKKLSSIYILTKVIMLKRTAMSKPRVFKNNFGNNSQKTPEIEALDNPFLLLMSWLTLKQKILLTRDFATTTTTKISRSSNRKKNYNSFCEERLIHCNKPTNDTVRRIQISTNSNQKIL